MKLADKIVVWIPYIILVLVISLFIFLQMQTYISIREDNLTVQIDLNPSHNVLPQETLVSWDVEGVQGIYFNDFGVIGHDQRVKDGGFCQPFVFDILTEDSRTLQFRLTPFIWTNPIHIIISSFCIFLFVSVIASLFSIPILKDIGNRIIEVFDINREDYWHHNGMFWLRVLLWMITVFLCNPLFVTTCLSPNNFFELPPSVMALVFLGMFSIILLVVSILKPQILLSIVRRLKHFLPYPLVGLVVFLYWAVSFDATVHLPEIYRLPIRILIFTLGATLLFIGQNTRDMPLNIRIPTSGLGRWLFLLSSTILWVFSYQSQWASIINNYFLQTLVGLALFIIPGCLLVRILISEHLRWTRLITLGFIFSIFVVTILVPISIILGLSATVFQWLFTIIGLLLLLYILKNKHTVTIPVLTVTSFSLFEILMVSFSLVSILLLGLVMRDMPSVNGDYLTYNAMVTQFAETSQFSLADPFLGTDNLMKPRLWLLAWPISQSLIVLFSNLNILLIFQNLNFLLVFLVIFAVYDLLHRFEVPRQFALISIIAIAFAVFTQLSSLTTVGTVFLYRLAQDKVMVAWLLSPIVVGSAYDFLKHGNLRYGIIFSAVALATVNVHATIFFYIGLIVGILVTLYVLFQSRKWQHIIIVGMILGSCTLIPFTLRYIAPDDFTFDVADIPEKRSEHHERHIESLALSDDLDVLYGISPQLRDGIAFIMVYVATGIALFTLKSFPLGYYIIACSVLLLAVSNPITAPLIGKLISPFQLWRAPLLMPFGIATTVVLYTLSRYTDLVSSYVSRFILLTIIVGAVSTMTNVVDKKVSQQKLNPYRDSYLQEQPIYKALVEAAHFIQLDTDQSRIMVFTDSSLSNLIPSMASDVYTLIWRKYRQAGLSLNVYRERRVDHDRVHANDLTLSEFHNLIDKYTIQYIILPSGFRGHLKSLLENSPRIIHDKNFGRIVVWIVSQPPT
jgi:hypothetical protein